MDEPGRGSTDARASAGPVEPPRRRVELELGRRRHRYVTAPAGLVLFVCMFLPAVKGCSAPVYPLEMPMFLPPYLYGLAFAYGAATLTARGMRNAIVVVRAITIVMLVGSGVLLLLSPAVGIIELLISASIFMAVDLAGHSERRAASTATIVGAICSLWFGFWAVTSEALLGAYLSLGSSIGLVLGGLVWLGETAENAAPLILIPRAVARRRE